MLSKKTLLFDFFSENKLRMFVTLVASILSNLLSILIPVSIGKYYDLVFDFHSHRSQILNFLPFDIGKNIKLFLIFFFILITFKSVFLFIEKYSFGSLSERLAYQLRNQLFEAQLALPISIYEEKGIGKYSLRFSGDLKSIQTYLRNGIIRFISDIVLLIATIIILILFHFQLGLIVGGSLMVSALLIILLNQRLSKITRERRNSKSYLLTFVNARLRAMHSIQYFNKENPEYGKFIKKSNRVFDAGIEYQKITAFMKTLVPTSMYIMLGLVLGAVFFYKQNVNAIAGSTLLIFVMLLITLMPIFRRLLNVNIVWELGNISFEKLLKVLNQVDNEEKELPDLKLTEQKITLHNVSFNYSEKNTLLKNINWDFQPNSINLVSGSSGSGKGLLIKLISRMYKLEEGEICIDGQNILLVNSKSVRKNIAVVSSNLPLLGKTVFEAISYSRKESKRLKASEMLDKLQVFVPIKQRINLDDLIGDLGSNLSKGQQKILVYARAFLTNKKILLIDEPAVDLDDATVVQIFQMLEEMKKDKTIILFSRQEEFLLLNIEQHFSIDNAFQYYSL